MDSYEAVFRFKYYLMKPEGLTGAEFRSHNPVPIYSEAGKIVGFGNTYDSGSKVYFECALDPACPERFDLQLNLRKYYLNANLNVRGLQNERQVAHVYALVLQTDIIEGQPEVSLLEL
jgi:hypothetical protein